MKIKGGYIAIFVQNLEKAKEFYIETLGLKLIMTTPTGNFIFLDAGGITIGLYRTEAAEKVTPFNISRESKATKISLALQVDDINAFYRKLKTKGVHFLDEPTDWFFGERDVHFLDPDGNLIKAFKQIPRKR